MMLAYADPPYLGCCGLYGHNHPEGDRPFDGRCWDDPVTHQLLISWLRDRYTGWALSMGSNNIVELAAMLPTGIRWASWCKSFASFKPNVNPGYTWEPVAFVTTRDRSRSEDTARDHFVCPITLKKGLTGAKPKPFCSWVLDLIGWQIGDHVDDLFPGTGVMGEVVANRIEALSGARLQLEAQL